jgi:hypothetical protein
MPLFIFHPILGHSFDVHLLNESFVFFFFINFIHGGFRLILGTILMLEFLKFICSVVLPRLNFLSLFSNFNMYPCKVIFFSKDALKMHLI